MGIEPTSAAWEAAILPLNHARSGLPYQTYWDFGKPVLVRFARVNGPGLYRKFTLWEPDHGAFANSAHDKSCYAVRLLFYPKLRHIREGHRGL
jgi:hypothetical protein